MSRYNLLDKDGEFLGVVNADSPEVALERGKKQDPNTVSVELREEVSR